MANTLTNQIPTMMTALDTVSRELVGFIPAVDKDTAATGASLNQTIQWPVVPSMAAADITAAATGPDPSAQTIGNRTMTLSKSRSVTFYWEGEEQKGLNNAGTYGRILGDQYAQAFRTLTNEVESDVAGLYARSARALGTQGTTPFASNVEIFGDMKQLAEDLGCPVSNLACVLNTAAGSNLWKRLSGVAAARADEVFRTGMYGLVDGFQIFKSGQVKRHTAGTGASYAVNNASNYAAGSTTLALDTGTGTILAGDILGNSESGRDATKYVVGTALTAGSLAINAPGLATAWTDNDVVAIGAAYRANMFFDRGALRLATRPPAMPEGGDAADDVMNITDPVSGITFQVAMYKQRRRVAIEVGLVWGVAMVKSEHSYILLG